MPRVRSNPQLAMDEQVITDPDIEAALEDRQAAKEALNEKQASYEELNETAKAQLAKLELPVGAVARVGRFRIERKISAARSVSFETAAKERLAIGLIGDA